MWSYVLFFVNYQPLHVILGGWTSFVVDIVLQLETVKDMDANNGRICHPAALKISTSMIYPHMKMKYNICKDINKEKQMKMKYDICKVFLYAKRRKLLRNVYLMRISYNPSCSRTRGNLDLAWLRLRTSMIIKRTYDFPMSFVE